MFTLSGLARGLTHIRPTEEGIEVHAPFFHGTIHWTTITEFVLHHLASGVRRQLVDVLVAASKRVHEADQHAVTATTPGRSA